MTTIAILLTCHNRKDKTLACLGNVFSQTALPNIALSIYLVDDGSTDGTADGIKATYPTVHILEGDGTLFWNKGMHLAFSTAAKEDFDFYLWLNDDTILFENALAEMIATWRMCCRTNNHERHIVIGTTCDPYEKEITTYGGVKKRKGIHPLKFEMIPASPDIQYADALNGNCVLIPRSAFKATGLIDNKYTHACGDFDYGFRAKKAGCTLAISPGFIGMCGRNNINNTWKDQTLPLNVRLNKMFSRKGLPINNWFRFCFKYGGLFWPVWAISPYVKMIIGTVLLNKSKGK